MNLIGMIEFKKPPTDAAWDQMVQTHTELQPTKAIRIINPFTKAVSEITSAKRLAEVLKDGQPIGALRWCIDDSGVEIFGDAKQMTPLAKQVAKGLGGKYLPD